MIENQFNEVADFKKFFSIFHKIVMQFLQILISSIQVYRAMLDLCCSLKDKERLPIHRKKKF